MKQRERRGGAQSEPNGLTELKKEFIIRGDTKAARICKANEEKEAAETKNSKDKERDSP